MTRGELGCMTSPAQGNRIPAGAWWAADNGRFGKGWPGHGRWWEWLSRRVRDYGPDRCLFALAPDVPYDAAGTLAEARTWLAPIRWLGIPAGFAAQNGSEAPGMVPWGQFGVLFLAGDTGWKLGPACEGLCREAAARGVRIHMGRVSGLARLECADWFGCATADGTYLRWAPDKNLARMARFCGQVNRQPSLCSPGPAGSR